MAVSGTIDSLGKDILGEPYIALKTPNEFMVIQCMLAKGEEFKASQLQKGKQVEISGKNSGKLIGNIILQDCKIIKR